MVILLSKNMQLPVQTWNSANKDKQRECVNHLKSLLANWCSYLWVSVCGLWKCVYGFVRTCVGACIYGICICVCSVIVLAVCQMICLNSYHQKKWLYNSVVVAVESHQENLQVERCWFWQIVRCAIFVLSTASKDWHYKMSCSPSCTGL